MGVLLVLNATDQKTLNVWTIGMIHWYKLIVKTIYITF